MNKKMTALALALTSALAAPAAMAEKLEITGELVPTTCHVTSTGGTVTVDMGKVDLASVNSNIRAGQKNFSIALDCSGSGNDQDVGLRFGGTPASTSGNLALNAGSGARNVSVALVDSDGNQQKIGDNPTRFVTVPAGGSTSLDYSAWYEAEGTATAGTANASGDITVLYK